jgi:Cu(I)/Ag(I) efflux system protein CusF
MMPRNDALTSNRRTLAVILLTIAAAGFAAAPAAAADASHALVVAQAEKPSGQGTINAVDIAAHKLKMTHGPVTVLNWPGMTMDFGVAPDVDLATIKPGMKISFTLSRGADGQYVIDAIKPAESTVGSPVPMEMTGSGEVMHHSGM